MASDKRRRQILGAGGIRTGTGTAYTDFSTGGRLTMVGTARVQKDLWIPWSAFSSSGIGGSAAAGNSGSVTDAITVSGSIPALGFRNTTSACSVVAVVSPPLDAATTGSVTLLADWTYSKVAASVAVIGACVFYVQGGSVISDAGAFAGSGVLAASAINATACVITTSSFAQVNSFSGSTNGAIVIKFWRDAVSASGNAGSEFGLLGVRMRYLSNSLGPASTE